MGLTSFATRVLAVIGIIAIIVGVIVLYPNLLPIAQNEWNKAQPPRCAVASDCVLANNSCCSNATGNWTCAALDAHCAPEWIARVNGCWCGNGVCAANYSCEPERPTPTVDLPPFPPEDLEAGCVAKNGECCKGDVCSRDQVTCVYDSVPRFEGCDSNCIPIVKCVSASEQSTQPIPSASPAGLANPASVYCEDMNGTLEILNGLATPGQVGYCFFSDGTACEEWAFFRGDCKPGDCTFKCVGVGTRSEGWMDCENAFIAYANCAS